MDRRSITRLIATAVFGGVGVLAVVKIIKSLTNQSNINVYQRKKEIFIIQTEEDWEKFYEAYIHDQQIKVLGFDCEWVFHGRRRPVALLQLATQDRKCALIRIFKITTIPDSLKQILNDRSVIKVGVAPKDDAKKLFQDYGLFVRGCVDLRHILIRVRGIYECSSFGLQGLAEGVLGVTLCKDKAVRCGNWEADILSQRQIDYAADDAIVAVDIFTHIILAKIHKCRPETISKSKEVLTNDSRFWRTSRSLCQGVVDSQYKHTPRKGIQHKPSRMYKQLVKVLSEKEKQDTETSERDGEGCLDDDFSSDTECGEETSSLTVSSTAKLSQKGTKSYVVRQRPLYYNCSLIAPDGEVLCTCDVRKAAWYLEKGLADKVQDDPLTVRLRFEPAGRPTDDYYIQDKENICVVCGKGESFIRKCVIPREYRKYLPHQLKEHSSHDVLLMCVPCHMESTQHDTLLRSQLAVECDAPIDNGSGVKQHHDEDLRKIKSAAKALLTCPNQIPAQRRSLLEKTITDFYSVDEVTEDLLKKAVDIDYKILNRWYKPHGRRVVTYMKKNGGLYNFEKRWRQHFVDTMKPQFLPKKWSVSHRSEHHREEEMTDSEDDVNFTDSV